MADLKDFDRTPANNTSLDGISSDQNATQVAQVDDLIRSLMAASAPGTDWGDANPAVKLDYIAESTLDAGITAEGVLLKDNAVNVDTINEKTADAGVTIDGVLIKDGTIPSVGGLQTNAINGLVISNNTLDAEHDIDWATGSCRDDTDVDDITLASALTKRIDATWTVGNNNGGLDTGSVAAGSWYHTYIIKRSDTGVVDALFSLNVSSPTMPANYDRKRRVGAVLTDGAGNIIAFSAIELPGGALEVRWNDPPLDIDDTAQGTAAISRTLSVPDGLPIRVWLNAYVTHGSSNASMYIRSPSQDDEAPDLTAGPIATMVGMSGQNQGGMVGPFLTNNSRAVTTRSNVTNTTVRAATIVYEDSRRSA